MTYQTTYFVPWDEPEFMKMLEHVEGMTCVGVDTQGKTYISPWYLMNTNPLIKGNIEEQE